MVNRKSIDFGGGRERYIDGENVFRACEPPN